MRDITVPLFCCPIKRETMSDEDGFRTRTFVRRRVRRKQLADFESGPVDDNAARTCTTTADVRSRASGGTCPSKSTAGDGFVKADAIKKKKQKKSSWNTNDLYVFQCFAKGVR